MRRLCMMVMSIFAMSMAARAQEVEPQDLDWGLWFLYHSTTECADKSVSLTDCSEEKIVSVIKKVEVADIDCLSAGEKAGFKIGDEIISINGYAVTDMRSNAYFHMEYLSVRMLSVFKVRRVVDGKVAEETLSIIGEPTKDGCSEPI